MQSCISPCLLPFLRRVLRINLHLKLLVEESSRFQYSHLLPIFPKNRPTMNCYYSIWAKSIKNNHRQLNWKKSKYKISIYLNSHSFHLRNVHHIQNRIPNRIPNRSHRRIHRRSHPRPQFLCIHCREFLLCFQDLKHN